MQYNVWQSNIGYLLHPAITQREKLRVADVGTGTGSVHTPSPMFHISWSILENTMRAQGHVYVRS